MKRLIESPAILNLGIVLAVCGVVWDFWSTQQRGERMIESLDGIHDSIREVHASVGDAHVSIGNIHKMVSVQQRTLDTAIVNATAARKSINEALERRVDQLEDEHKWLSDVRQRAGSQSGEDMTALQAILQTLIDERRELYDELRKGASETEEGQER